LFVRSFFLSFCEEKSAAGVAQLKLALARDSLARFALRILKPLEEGNLVSKFFQYWLRLVVVVVVVFSFFFQKQ
jgi:hypothetical protein